MKDRYGRTIDYMRISITDRCNLRCKYCMPNDIETTSMSEILTFEEIQKIVEASVKLGIVNYRITGGEPLVRKGCANLIQMIKQTKGVARVGMTTNGVLLEKQVKALKEAGLDSLNVSLDTIDAEQFEKLSGKDELEHVLAGIDAALESGIPVKINTVNRKELDWKRILFYASKKGIPVRFIEMMPIGYGKDYMGISNEKLAKEIARKYGAAKTITESYGKGPANYKQFDKLGIDVGFISAMNHKFCNQCNRIRLTAEGYLKLCLCYNDGIDLRDIVRNLTKADTLLQVMKQAIEEKPLEHCFEERNEITESNAMIQIGG